MILSLYGSVSFKHPFGLSHTMDIASKLGYQAIDVRGQSLDSVRLTSKNVNAVGYDMIGPNSLDSFGIRELKAELKRKQLFISAISCYNPLTLPEGELADQSMDKFREMIDFSERLGIRFVRLIGYSERPYDDVSLDRATAKIHYAKRIKELCRYAAQRGVGIQLENGEGCIPRSAQEQLEIADLVDEPNLMIVFDVLNYAFEGLEPFEELKRIAKRVGCLHVKNARFNGGQYRGFEWALLSDGDIDYRPILRILHEHGFDGPIVCEYANPYKGMSRDFWDAMPAPQLWAEDARNFINTFTASV